MSENLREQIAEVLYETYWDLRDGVKAPKLGSFNAGREMADAVLAVVGPELDRLRAEVERQEGIVASQQRANAEDAATWRAAHDRGEAERADLRARLAAVEALTHGEWEFNVVTVGRIKAALASVPEPSDNAPAPDADREAGER